MILINIYIQINIYNRSWGKKSGEPDFDVPMSCYDEAVVCELVGIFILNKLSNILEKIFKDCRLSIMVTTNITSADLLDLTLNLKTESYQPFRKSSNNPIYTDFNLTHPPQLLKQLPKSISKRLSKNLSSKEVFDKSKMLYEKFLNNSGFYKNLKYHHNSRK